MEFVYGNIVFQFKNKRFVVLDMLIDGTACYCIHNLKTDKKVIFDHNDSVLDGIKRIQYLNNDWTVKHNGKRNGRLQAYLFLLYYGEEAAQSCHYTVLADNSMKEFGVTDLRKANIIPKELHPKNKIEIWTRPNTSDEKYIAVHCGGFTEVFNYCDTIYDELQRRLKQITTQNSREIKRLKFRKTKTDSGIYLSKFTLQKYVGKLKTDYVCGHIHSGYRWINCPENIMEMWGKTNDRMSDFASQIGGVVQMRSMVYRTGQIEKILVEIELVGCFCVCCVCDTPEQYTILQKEILGKLKLTEHTKLFVNGERVETPKEVYRRTKEKHNHTENKMEELWKWCDWRDRINARFTKSPNDFIPFSENLIDSLKNYKGKPLLIGCRITPIESGQGA